MFLGILLQVEIGDLEQLMQRGKKMKACPYYGTRYAIPAAQVMLKIMLQDATDLF